MDTTITKAILAGLFFGAWPLFMNRSGLQSGVAAFVIGAVVMITLSPFALSSFRSVATSSEIKWAFVAAAGITSALGLLSFNGVVARVSPQSVSAPFVLMVVVQAVVPAVYGVILNGGRLSAIRLAGFILAIASAILLTVKDVPPAK